MSLKWNPPIPNGIRSLANKTRQGLSDAREVVTGKANDIKDAVVGTTHDVTKSAVGHTRDAFEAVKRNPVTEAFQKSVTDPKAFVKDGVKGAGEVTQHALSSAKEAVLTPIDGAIDQATAPLESALTEEIKKLDSAGDTLMLSGNLDLKVKLKAGIAGEAEIERTADGKYQLSAEVTGDVGVGLLASASVSAGGRMEWQFDTPEEAAKAAVILGKGPAALASGGEDHQFVLEHLSAVEVNVGVEAEAGLGANFGPGGAELSVSLGATTGYRVEFEQGKPTHLVRTTEVEGSGAAGIAAGFKDKAGFSLGGDVTGSVSLETKIPLDASQLDGKDVLAFVANPATAVFAGPAETTITVEGSVDAGTQGQFFTAEVSGLRGEDVQAVTKRLLAGEFVNAFDDVQVEAKVTQGSFEDREAALGAKLAVVDFEFSARHRDVTVEGGNGSGGTTVSLGSGKRRAAGSGPSGAGGAPGSPGPSGGSAMEGPAQAERTPLNNPASRPPPNEFRVNSATGQLIPTARSESARPRAAGPLSSPSRTPREESGGTTRSSVPVIRNPELPGRTTHVRYDDGRVHIEAGPAATPEDILAHMETARILQRYEGAIGKVRQLIEQVKQAITGMPGYGSQGFESRLEVQKLSNILRSLESTQAQLRETLTGAEGTSTPATAAQLADLERQISSVERQLQTHAGQVDSLTAGRGYVAREDDVAPVDETSPEGRLPQGVPSWVAGALPPGVPPEAVHLQEATDGAGSRDYELRDREPHAAYWVGDTWLYLTDGNGRIDMVVNRAEVTSLPAGVAPWVAGVLPPNIRPGDVRVERSMVTNGGTLNPNLNNPQPDTAYWVDGRFLFVTDAHARTVLVEGDLQRVGPGGQVRHRETQRQGSRQYHTSESGVWTPMEVSDHTGTLRFKYRGDEGGHYAGAQFGGPPERINIFPQPAYENGSVRKGKHDPRSWDGDARRHATSESIRNWYEADRELSRYINAGDSVRIRIQPQFVGRGGNRPDRVFVRATLTTQTGDVAEADWRFNNTMKVRQLPGANPSGG
ncbi:hypothetical protein ACLEPN_15345 [Myxococcus sp. 1LA]